MKIFEITSVKNEKVKAALKLRDRKWRDETNLFLIEGYRELSRAIIGKEELQELFFCKEFFLGENEEQIIENARKGGAEIISCIPYVFEKLSYRDRPDGLLAVAKQQHQTIVDLEKHIKGKVPFLLIAEGIEKPGNLGTILRSCDGVGASAFVGVDLRTDIYNPNTVRSSVGTLFTVPHFTSSSAEMLSFLKEHKIKIVAATPQGKVLFTKCDLKGPLAIVVGSEQYGLTSLWMDNADYQISIPMKGVADSLNVATATTLLLYEALRQR